MGNIEINKGCYNIDSLERVEAFQAARAYRNEDAYYEYRKNWDEYPKNKFVSEYPLSLEFNITNACNLKCPFCYRSQANYDLNNDKFMEFELFRKAIDETAGKVPAIRFNSSGESILHPDFLKMVKYAKDRGAIEVSFITNSGALTPNYFEKLLLAGIDWITVSVDGLYEEYEKNRYPLKFNETYKRLEAYKKIKQSYHTPKPAINVQAVWPFIENNVEEYVNLMSEVSDCVNYKVHIDFNKLNNFNAVTMQDQFCCSQPMQRMLVWPNGNVGMCCSYDPNQNVDEVQIGNITNQTIYDIWNGESFNKARAIVCSSDGYLQFKQCKKCPLPHSMEERNIVINGKTRVIKTYIF